MSNSDTARSSAAWQHRINRASTSEWGETTDFNIEDEKTESGTEEGCKDESGGVPTRLWEQKITTKKDVDLRRDAYTHTVSEMEDGVGNIAEFVQNRPVDVGTAVDRWVEYADDDDLVVLASDNPVNGNTEYLVGGDPHRFTSDYKKRYYAKLQAFSRGFRKDYGDDVSTAMITLSASSGDNRIKAPIDHLTELLSSWSSVRREMSRVMSGVDNWERIAVLEPHKTGHVHIHIGVFADDELSSEQFSPVVDSHVKNCPSAGFKAHEDAVSVSGEVENVGAYLSSYIGDSWADDGDIDTYADLPAHVQIFNTSLWLSGTQQFRPSNGAQEYMTDPSPIDELVNSLRGVVSHFADCDVVGDDLAVWGAEVVEDALSEVKDVYDVRSDNTVEADCVKSLNSTDYSDIVDLTSELSAVDNTIVVNLVRSLRRWLVDVYVRYWEMVGVVSAGVVGPVQGFFAPWDDGDAYNDVIDAVLCEMHEIDDPGGGGGNGKISLSDLNEDEKARAHAQLRRSRSAGLVI